MAYDETNDEYSVSESPLLLPTIHAVQQLIKKVELQQEKIEDLQQQIQELKSAKKI